MIKQRIFGNKGLTARSNKQNAIKEKYLQEQNDELHQDNNLNLAQKLKNISDRLTQIEQTAKNPSDPNLIQTDNNSNNYLSNNNVPTEQLSPNQSQELQSLFKEVFKGNTTQSQNPQQNANSNNQSNNQNMVQDIESTNENYESELTVQTASQLLSQAQYELAEELEATLKNLKMVITESERIANKISSLIGEQKQS